MERFIENTMYASRWLLAPIYLGLSIAVLLLGIKFFQEAFHTLPLVFSLKEADLVLVVLSLVDMALVGGLLVMVMLSGYENFVSQIDIEEGKEKLEWLGKTRLGLIKAEGCRIHRCHFFHSFAESLHECAADSRQQAHVVRNYPFNFCSVRAGYGLCRQDEQALMR